MVKTAPRTQDDKERRSRQHQVLGLQREGCKITYTQYYITLFIFCYAFLLHGVSGEKNMSPRGLTTGPRSLKLICVSKYQIE